MVRKSGPPKVTLAIHGAMPLAGCEEDILVTCSAKNAARGHRPFWVTLVQQHAQVALWRQHEQFVGIHHRAPQIAHDIEGDAVRPRAFTQARWPKISRLFRLPSSPTRNRSRIPPVVSTRYMNSSRASIRISLVK